MYTQGKIQDSQKKKLTYLSLFGPQWLRNMLLLSRGALLIQTHNTMISNHPPLCTCSSTWSTLVEAGVDVLLVVDMACRNLIMNPLICSWPPDELNTDLIFRAATEKDLALAWVKVSSHSGIIAHRKTEAHKLRCLSVKTNLNKMIMNIGWGFSNHQC